MIAAFADRMAQWPNILIVLSFSSIFLLLMFLARWLGRHILPAERDEMRATAALDTFKLLGPLAGVFLSFSLVQSISQFRVADTNVSREATNIYQLDRALALTPQALDARPARLALRDYLQHVVTDDWAALREGRAESETTVEALTRLHEAVEALEASFPSQVRATSDIDDDFDDVQDDRATRLGIAHGGLPAVMWWVLALLLCLLFACAASLQRQHARHPLPVLYIAGLGLLAAVLFIIDRPFQGELSISPAPLVKVLGQLDARLK